MKPAERTLHINEYYFSRKLREIQNLKNKGHNVLNLGIGSPDLDPHETIIKTLQKNLEKPNAFNYQPYRGLDKLRNAMSSWYNKTYNVILNSEKEIIPLMGSKEGIGFISLAYLQQGDKVLVPNPGYPAYASAAKIAGAEVIHYNLTKNNGWAPNIEELRTLVDEKVKLMWINYPNMPTGAKGSPGMFKELIDFAKSRNILLCNDNPYSLILNPSPISILNTPEAKDICLELNSLSKSHNMAGARIGMLVGKEELINEVFKIQSNFSSGMFGPLQEAAIAALDLGNEWIDSLNSIYLQRKLIAQEIFTALGCDYSEHGSGLFIWGKVPPIFSNGESISDKLLHEAEVFIAPGFIFGSNGNEYIRISLCAPLSVLKEARDRIIKLKINNKKNIKSSNYEMETIRNRKTASHRGTM